MRQKLKELKARVSMVWHALTASECVVSWLEDGAPFCAYIASPDKWKTIRIDVEE